MALNGEEATAAKAGDVAGWHCCPPGGICELISNDAALPPSPGLVAGILC